MLSASDSALVCQWVLPAIVWLSVMYPMAAQQCTSQQQGSCAIPHAPVNIDHINVDQGQAHIIICSKGNYQSVPICGLYPLSILPPPTPPPHTI